MFTKPMKPAQLFAYIGLLFFLYLLTYYFFQGIIHPIPAQGDSYTYHIPISQTILNGTFIQPSHFTPKIFMGIFNPGASEAINALLMLLHIPLTISNLIAIVVLFFCCFNLARTFKLEYYMSLLFAESICTLTVISRWFNAVSVDVWLANYFTLAIILLQKPKKTNLYALLLGILFGMMIGSKYSALAYVSVLTIAYWRTIFQIVSIKRFIIFLIPVSILGLFWYVRNYLAVGNPMWPLCEFSLPCQGIYYNNHAHMWDTTLRHPLTMFNAFYSEYKLWGLSLLLPFFVLFAKLRGHIKLPPYIATLCFIGFANFIILLPQPTSDQPWIMVSSFRYSYPIFIPLILSTFILAKQYKKEMFLGLFAIANMFPVLSLEYLPKLLVVYFPLALVIMYLVDKKLKIKV